MFCHFFDTSNDFQHFWYMFLTLLTPFWYFCHFFIAHIFSTFQAHFFYLLPAQTRHSWICWGSVWDSRGKCLRIREHLWETPEFPWGHPGHLWGGHLFDTFLTRFWHFLTIILTRFDTISWFGMCCVAADRCSPRWWWQPKMELLQQEAGVNKGVIGTLFTKFLRRRNRGGQGHSDPLIA